MDWCLNMDLFRGKPIRIIDRTSSVFNLLAQLKLLVKPNLRQLLKLVYS